MLRKFLFQNDHAILDVPIGSMGLPYLPTFGCFLWYINVGKYTIHGSCGVQFHDLLNQLQQKSVNDAFTRTTKH